MKKDHTHVVPRPPSSRGPQVEDYNIGRHSNNKRRGRIHSIEHKDDNIATH